MKKYEDGGKVDEMSKKNTKGYKQKYTDDTEENEAVRKAIIKTPSMLKGMVKNTLQGLSRGIPKDPEDSKTKKKESKKSLSQLGASVLEKPEEKEYKKGGMVHKMPDGTMMKGAKHGMKKGGSVKSIDGIAVRGKTRCK